MTILDPKTGEAVIIDMTDHFSRKQDINWNRQMTLADLQRAEQAKREQSAFKVSFIYGSDPCDENDEPTV
jgi:hypothetical protein